MKRGRNSTDVVIVIKEVINSQVWVKDMKI